MKRTPLKKKSSKQIIRDLLWQSVKQERLKVLEEKYEAPICEYCGKPAYNSIFGILIAHHIDQDRRNNTEENCYICHWVCHSDTHLKNLRVKQLGFEGIKNGGNDVI